MVWGLDVGVDEGEDGLFGAAVGEFFGDLATRDKHEGGDAGDVDGGEGCGFFLWVGVGVFGVVVVDGGGDVVVADGGGENGDEVDAVGAGGAAGIEEAGAAFAEEVEDALAVDRGEGGVIVVFLVGSGRAVGVFDGGGFGGSSYDEGDDGADS